MIKQMKGKMLDKIPVSRLAENNYYMSIKYDGNYCQIHKNGNFVIVKTSGGKDVYLPELEEQLNNITNEDVILEAEFVGESKGKLGDRTKCGIMTTWRVNTAKGIRNELGKNRFMVFDIIKDGIFADRLKELPKYQTKNLISVTHSLTTLEEAKKELKTILQLDYEGLVLKHAKNIYKPGKRVNDIIKLKGRATADLICIGTEGGELGSKYEHMIGSLVLRNKRGITVKVGSGLDDADRSMGPDYYIGKVVEIEFEQILDTYIQPTFITVRHDKTIKDID